MDAVIALLILYAGATFLNTVISAILWISQKALLYRALFFVWATVFFAFLIQAAIPPTAPPIVTVLGFAFVFVHNYALAHLIASTVGFKLPWRRFVIGMAVAIAGSLGAHFSGQSFFWIAIPTVLGLSSPLIFAAVRSLIQWKTLTFASKGLAISCLFLFMHYLDYPILRPVPSMAQLGFTIAILLIFALSIFAPAVVLEIVADKQARIATEMEVAHRIQMDILPRNPKIPGLEISCYMKPAEEVGGDYYDIYSFGNYSWIMVGDVTGHGLSSGLVMLMAQSIISSILHTKKDITPGELNFLANKLLYQNLQRLKEDRSMTIVSICRKGDDTGYVFSGTHDNIYIYRAENGEVETINVGHIPAGLGFVDDLDRREFTEGGFRLHNHDLLFLGTDGVTEAAREGDYRAGLFDEKRLIEFIKTNAKEPLDTIKSKLVSELDIYTKGVYHDDVTFVLARSVSPEVVRF